MNRRSFISRSAAGALALQTRLARAQAAASAAGRRLRVAVVGLGRGRDHVQALLTLPDVEIAHLSDVDPVRLETALKMVAQKQPAKCEGAVDFRTFLEDSTLDAVFIALPNFWHTPAALLCLAAGKHVYVEKPGSQNPREAEMIVAAQQKYDRLVQMGNQRRTWMAEAIAALHGGAIGTLRNARAFYYNARGPIGQGANKAAPGLDRNLWQGPVPDERDMTPFIHYDWHWLWHWGNGELGNNGIHFLDILRWGLGADAPLRVSYTGGRYFYPDAQETPDTAVVAFDFGKVGITWEHSSSQPRAAEKPLAECLFYGDGGTMAVNNKTFAVYDEKGTKKSEGKSPGGGDADHMGNFLESIRGKATLNSPIVEGQKSTMLCHLGNIAYRLGATVHFDPATRKIAGLPEADKLWGRPAYRAGWEVKV